MRRIRVTMVAAGVVTALAVGTVGCGAEPAAGVTPAGRAPASVRAAEVYIQVLRRYLSTPAENSFPGQAFTTVYLLDRAYREAAVPGGTHDRGTPITAPARRQVTAALAGLAPVVFITSQNSVLETRDGCGHVKNGGILITLGPLDGGGHRVQVAVNGFVACLGATWLTYVLQNQPGSGWRVTGTTGPIAIS